ncbi:MAG: transglycosylase SLT domain-containing protein, partial [Anaerolineales bacterium]|nr:transglycosylase SLT domain-containing protein [Anaerolineales bacterium]
LRAGLAHAAAPPAVDTAAAAARSVVTPAATAATAPAAAAGGSLSAVFTPEVQQWAADILRWAAAYQLDPNLIATLMQVESCGDPQAHSGAGAQGLFQVMPHHFSRGENMWDPDTNARRGLAYFNRGLRVHQGDVFRSFAGYNAGHATAAQPWATWPRETQQFHYWTSGIYVAARAGQAHSDVLQAWLRAGGADLCRQAADRLGW